MVEDAQFAGDCAIRQLPGNAVRFSKDLISLVLSGYRNYSVTIAVCGAGPFPAAVSPLNFCPKTFSKWYTWSTHGRTSNAVKVRNSNGARYIVAVLFIAGNV